jgi:dipeptidyl aminopeptidase/acylaminoacyl peptidase
MMAEELEKHGVEFKLITIPGAEHGLGGGDPKLIKDAYEAALSFANQEMQRPSDSQ